MKFTKGAMLVALGAGSVFAYQKYSKPVMNKMQNLMDDAIDKVNEKLEDMK